MRRHATLALTSLLAACGGDVSEAALNVPVIDTAEGGIIHVVNPGPTRWAGTTGWRLVEERVIAPPEGSPGELSYARGIVADANGNIFVLEREPATIKVFGSDGRWLHNIGREGDGPGEFRDGMLGIRGDTLLVQDPDNQRLTTFLTDGTPVGTHQSQCCVSNGRALMVFDDGRAVIPGLSPDQGRPGMAHYLTDMAGVVSDTIIDTGTVFSAGEEVHDPTVWQVTRRRNGATSLMVLGVPNRPRDEEAWRPNGSRVVGNTGSYRLAVVSLVGDTVRTISAPAPVLTLTIVERDSLYEEEMAGLDESWRDAVRATADPNDIPTTRPAWSEVTVDPQNRIWVSRPDPHGKGNLLDVLTADGVLLGTLPAPTGGINGTWVGDRVYVRDTDDNDLPVIRVLRLEQGSTP